MMFQICRAGLRKRKNGASAQTIFLYVAVMADAPRHFPSCHGQKNSVAARVREADER
jgi:hypothetical protein